MGLKLVEAKWQVGRFNGCDLPSPASPISFRGRSSTGIATKITPEEDS